MGRERKGWEREAKEGREEGRGEEREGQGREMEGTGIGGSMRHGLWGWGWTPLDVEITALHGPTFWSTRAILRGENSCRSDEPGPRYIEGRTLT
jgi:hypothetical protein